MSDADRPSVYGMLPAEVDTLVLEAGGERYRADQLLRAVYRDGIRGFEEARQLPAGLRERLAELATVTPAREVRRVVSEDGLTTKLLLAMTDGTLIETVLMQYPAEGGRHPRSTVCVSTQAGCAMGCVFCATGQMGFERNLRAAEIVAQVVTVAGLLRDRGEHVTNVVFMGMGEPLANYAETIRAVRILTDPRAFGLGQRHITISTVGVVRGIDRLAGEGLQVGLAISLHAPNDALRRRLVPTAGPHSVSELMAAARRYFVRTGRRVTFEYALIAGVNDSETTARELARLVRGTGAHVNLIPVNPTAGGFARPARRQVLAFERVLREAGVNCTVRVEKGTEISAACGQLRTDAAAPVVIGEAEARGPASGRGPGARPAGPSRAPSRSR
ncbi:23S rRNA (adenine(2503)-C(2))-methyltransferase RlmN [Tepidiforma sp.]|uniref:23S rRNA (adenine(2503)-C(2))-methyltransferase RlmN n=1 Tax=Tepidiforma sp. TaxID=2682230 RepID=UPI002ADE4E5B|nr:23S rRNA (adenine(2503)-C(2))-methyltransferase RlmN [Tepidiforma sp.]